MENYFVFYRSFYEAFKELPGDEFKETVSALAEYALDGTEPEGLSPAARMAYFLTKPVIDANTKRRQNGKKGGRPAKNKKTIGYENENHRLQNKKPDIYQDNYQEEEEEEEEEEEIEVEKEIEVEVEKEEEEEEEIEGEEDNNVGAGAPLSASRADDEIIRHWNSLPESIPRISKIPAGGKRRRMLSARIKENGIRAVINAIDRIKESEFLTGNNSKGWRVTFDWFINPSNYAKVAEGNYSDWDSRQGSSIDDYMMGIINGDSSE